MGSVGPQVLGSPGAAGWVSQGLEGWGCTMEHPGPCQHVLDLPLSQEWGRQLQAGGSSRDFIWLLQR